MTEPTALTTDTPAQPAPKERVIDRVQKKGLFPTWMADVIAGASSLTAGAVTAWRIIEERAYKNISSIHLIEDIKSRRIKAGPEILEEVKINNLSPDDAYTKIVNKIQHFGGEMEKRFKENGVTSIWKEYGALHPHQKREVVISALSTAGITLGAVLLLAREFSYKQQKEINDKADGNEIQR